MKILLILLIVPIILLIILLLKFIYGDKIFVDKNNITQTYALRYWKTTFQIQRKDEGEFDKILNDIASDENHFLHKYNIKMNAADRDNISYELYYAGDDKMLMQFCDSLPTYVQSEAQLIVG